MQLPGRALLGVRMLNGRVTPQNQGGGIKNYRAHGRAGSFGLPAMPSAAASTR